LKNHSSLYAKPFLHLLRALSWLSEQGYLAKGVKQGKEKSLNENFAEEVGLLDTMLTSLVELLE
jgi:hypothetical protein